MTNVTEYEVQTQYHQSGAWHPVQKFRVFDQEGDQKALEGAKAYVQRSKESNRVNFGFRIIQRTETIIETPLGVISRHREGSKGRLTLGPSLHFTARQPRPPLGFRSFHIPCWRGSASTGQETGTSPPCPPG